MKVNDPNSLVPKGPAASTAPAIAQTNKTSSVTSRSGDSAVQSSSGDDVHLSELVRVLRSLAADSPERQAHIEQIARTYAQGNYQVDTQATANGIIDDAIKHTTL